jgi:signal transduction histidine kinase
MVEPPSTERELHESSGARAELEDERRQVEKLEAIGTLAGGMAHAFNNILGAMVGYTQMAKMEMGAMPQASESLDEVLRAGQRGKDLIHKILTFSRCQPSLKRSLRLETTIAAVQRALASTLPPTIALELTLSPDTESVNADPTQLEQVLVNLVTNAARALHGRVGKITIQLQNRELALEQSLPPGKYVELAVLDDGCGMEPAMRERIFEPFFGTKTPGEGSGLGLAVVYGIVRDHGGVVRVDSQPGVGSSFRVLLPACGIPPLL